MSHVFFTCCCLSNVQAPLLPGDALTAMQAAQLSKRQGHVTVGGAQVALWFAQKSVEGKGGAAGPHSHDWQRINVREVSR